MLKTHEQIVAEFATGIEGAGDYRKEAESMGFPHLSVFDWTSSAGDWTFIVSQDGKSWYVMSRENNWPSTGFTYYIDTEEVYCGTSDKVAQQIADEVALMYA